MSVKRVYVLSHRCMFHDGIETLLSQEEGIEIIKHESDPERSLECIREHDADVVIVNLDDPAPYLSQTVMKLLQENLDVSILGLSLKDNSIRIYRTENKMVHQVEDLMDLIQD